MKELHLERQFFTAPQRVLRQETYLPVVVVVELLQVVRQFGVGRLVRFAGGVAGYLPDNRPVKRERLRSRGRNEPPRRREQGQRSCSVQKTSTVPGAPTA